MIVSILEDEIPRDGGKWPEYASTMLLCFDGWEGSVATGRLFTFYSGEPHAFCDLGDLLLAMDAVMDNAGQPDAWCELRHLTSKGKRKRPEEHCTPLAPSKKKPLPADALNGVRGKLCTVSVRVYTRQHASMQGEVRFHGHSPQQVYFRSALELLHLLRERLEQTGRKEGEP